MHSQEMASHVFVVVLTLVSLLNGNNGEQSACLIRQCQCTNSLVSRDPDVTCYVNSITPYDATLMALPPNVTSLKFSCNDKKMPSFFRDGIFQKFTSLQSLTVEKCNVTQLYAGSFRGLFILRNLFITQTALPRNLDNDIFTHLPQLQSLTITFCELTFLPHIFHLTSLQYLNVSSNNLHNIGDSVFKEIGRSVINVTETAPLGSLSVFDASHNNITLFPLDLIERAPSLQRLLLLNIGMTRLRIPEEISLRHLVVLDARQNPLEEVDFPGLGLACDLEELRLDGTGFPLNFQGVSHLVLLKELALTNFAINDSIWQELNSTDLTMLDLKDNELTMIDVSRLPNLTIILLQGNKISALNSETFENQPNLFLVGLSRNNITSLPSGIFQSNPKLQGLGISHNSITSLGFQSLYGLGQLLHLDLSNNNLSDLPYLVFRDTSSILHLYLEDNKLTRLPKLSYMPELGLLNVSNNELTSLTHFTLQGLTRLHSLYANNNKLTALEPNVFSENPGLMQVWLGNNQIHDIGTLGYHPNLTILALNNNQLQDFITESPFLHLKALKQLDLDGNKFERIRLHMFPPTVQDLFMSENYISTVYTTSFEDLPELRSFHFTYNQRILSISEVAVSRFKHNDPKPRFYFTGDHFLCDCDMGYLKVIDEDGYSQPAFNTRYARFYGLEYTMCVTPFEGFAVRPFKEVPLSHFVCSYDMTWCDVFCDARCCIGERSCDCALTCPSGCDCYYGGSAFKKIYIHIQCNSRNFSQVPEDIPSRVVILHLDGNNLTHLSISEFDHFRDTEIIYLNGSNIETIENGTFDQITKLLMLRLEDNLLTTIGADLFGNMDKIKKIYLHDNLIQSISFDAFRGLSSIEIITLHNNKLVLLDTVPAIPSLHSITLGGNPWSCNCDTINVIYKAINTLNKVILDKQAICCYGFDLRIAKALKLLQGSSSNFVAPTLEGTEITLSPSEERVDESGSRISSTQGPLLTTSASEDEKCLPLLRYSYEEICNPGIFNAVTILALKNNNIPPGVVALIVVVIILIITGSMVVIVLVKRKELQAWAFVKLGVRVFDKKAHIDKEDAGTKAFDAFISYSSKDDEFVATTLVPALEGGDRRYRTCVHYRDFPVGKNIADTIFRAIENSSRTILLLSENFLKSEWCRFEFQTAHHHILREGSHRLIIVILGEIPEEMLDPDLKVHLKSKTYLKYDDPWFWEKLYFALPDVKAREQNPDEDRHMDVLRGMRILAGTEVMGHERHRQEQVQDGHDLDIDLDDSVEGEGHFPIRREDKLIQGDDNNEINEEGQGFESRKQKQIHGHVNKGLDDIYSIGLEMKNTHPEYLELNKWPLTPENNAVNGFLGRGKGDSVPGDFRKEVSAIVEHEDSAVDDGERRAVDESHGGQGSLPFIDDCVVNDSVSKNVDDAGRCNEGALQTLNMEGVDKDNIDEHLDEDEDEREDCLEFSDEVVAKGHEENHKQKTSFSDDRRRKEDDDDGKKGDNNSDAFDNNSCGCAQDNEKSSFNELDKFDKYDKFDKFIDI